MSKICDDLKAQGFVEFRDKGGMSMRARVGPVLVEVMTAISDGRDLPEDGEPVCVSIFPDYDNMNDDNIAFVLPGGTNLPGAILSTFVAEAMRRG